MNAERRRRFAEVIAGFCQEAGPGERVMVEATPAAMETATAVAGELAARGAEPVLLNHGNREEGLRTREETLWETLTGYVSLRTEGERHLLRELPPAGNRIRQLRMTLRKTTTSLPDAELAGRAGLGLAELEDYYASLLHLDEPDAAARFHELRDFQDRIIGRLGQADEVRIEGSGTDLTMSVRGRTWVNSYGRRNIPSGEMYTSPVETSLNGIIHFDVPSFNFSEPVAGVTLEFRDGELVHASAEEGNGILQEQIRRDAGASVVGELGIGGNRTMTRFLGSTLFDEKVAGTVHLALGKGYPQTGGTNDSVLHWDLIKDLRGGGRISLDGEVLQEEGRFSIS